MNKKTRQYIFDNCKRFGLDEYDTGLFFEILKSQIKRKSPTSIASITSVSKSGLSRKIKFGYFSKSDRFIDVTYIFAKIYGEKNTENGLRVNGCGMDIIFHVLYTVYCNVFPRGSWGEYNKFCKYVRF